MTVFHEKRREYMSNKNIILKEQDSLEQWDDLFDKMVEEEFPQDTVEEDVDTLTPPIEEVEEEVIEEESTEDLPPPSISDEDKQRNYQFASLRNENKQLVDEMAEMAKTLGFSGVNEMREQVEKYRLKAEMEKRNIPEEQESDYLALAKEREEVEAEKQRILAFQEQQNRAQIHGTIDKVLKDYGLTVEEADKALADQGFNASDLMAVPHLAEVMLRGALQGVAKTQIRETVPKPAVESDPIKTTRSPLSPEKVDLDKLIDLDLEEMGYNR